MADVKNRLQTLIEQHGFNTVKKITGYSGSTLGMYADDNSSHNIPSYRLELAERQLCDLIKIQPKGSLTH